MKRYTYSRADKKTKNSFLILLLVSLTLVACATQESQQRTNHQFNIEPDKNIVVPDISVTPVLRVVTLNLAHGRKDSFNQIFVWENTFKENLDDIVDVLRQYKPHVVALQEADAESLWSVSFDHVAYLASGAEYPWRTHAKNSDNWLYT